MSLLKTLCPNRRTAKSVHGDVARLLLFRLGALAIERLVPSSWSVGGVLLPLGKELSPIAVDALVSVSFEMALGVCLIETDSTFFAPEERN
jgi:hypothetical protein